MTAKAKAWIGAMRLHTLPVSMAGVLTGGGCAAFYGSFKIVPFIICLVFAISAQIVSNFANEYFDYRNGLRPQGSRGVQTRCDGGRHLSTRHAQRHIRTARRDMPARLQPHNLGRLVAGFRRHRRGSVRFGLFHRPLPAVASQAREIAVIIFFGFVPVVFTAYVQTGSWDMMPVTLPLSLGIGFMIANVLVVNNYRDIEDDRRVGKKTLAVRWGKRAMERLYLLNGFIALLLVEIATALAVNPLWQIGALLYINFHYLTWVRLCNSEGSELNPVLGRTAMLIFLFSIWLFVELSLK